MLTSIQNAELGIRNAEWRFQSLLKTFFDFIPHSAIYIPHSDYVHLPEMGKLQKLHFPFVIFISKTSKCVREINFRLQEGQYVEL